MDPLNILAVCTGNICRSPLAEYHLKDALDPHDFTISSAGTHAVQNGCVSDPQIAIARHLGLTDIVHHRATQLTRTHIAQADLILTATLGHRRSAVQIVPSASVKTFTIREFAHLCSHVREQDITELIANGLVVRKIPAAAVHQLRGLITPPDDVGDYDVVDPFGADEQIYETSASQLLSALDIVESYLTKVASVVQQSTVQQSTPLNTAFPTEGNPHPSGKHSYDSLNPEQLRMREQVSRRMREQLSQGKPPVRRRHAK